MKKQNWLSRKNLKKLFERCIKRGLFHIFGASIINKFLAFFTNILIVRFLSKELYGIFSYSNNFYSICILLTGFGLASGMFQFCSEERENSDKESILSYCLIFGLVINLILGLLMYFTGALIPLSIESSGKYLMMMAPLTLLDYAVYYFSMVLRSKLLNKEYAFLQIVNAATYLAFGCGGAYLAGVEGTIIGRYCSLLTSCVLGIMYIKKHGIGFGNPKKLFDGVRKQIWKFSVPTCIASSLNQLTYLLDIFFVGYFIASTTEIAGYKVATLLPEGFLFVPACLMVYVTPYFIKNNTNRKWYAAKLFTLMTVSTAIYALISIGLILFSDTIICFLWGDEYLPSVPMFKILAGSFLFSSIRSTCANLLSTLRKVKANLWISVMSLILNVSLCLVLIPTMGTIGASLVPLFTAFISMNATFVLLIRSVKSMPDNKSING